MEADVAPVVAAGVEEALPPPPPLAPVERAISRRTLIHGSLLDCGLKTDRYTAGITIATSFDVFVLRAETTLVNVKMLLYMHGSGGPPHTDKNDWSYELADRKTI